MQSFKFKKFSKSDIILVLIILFVIVFWLSGGLGYIFAWYRQSHEQKGKIFTEHRRNQEANDLSSLKNKIWDTVQNRKDLQDEIVHFNANSAYFCQFETDVFSLEKFMQENNISAPSDSSGGKLWDSMFNYFKSSKIKLPSYAGQNIIIRKTHFQRNYTLYLYSCKTENNDNVDVYVCISK